MGYSSKPAARNVVRQTSSKQLRDVLNAARHEQWPVDEGFWPRMQGNWVVKVVGEALLSYQ